MIQIDKEALVLFKDYTHLQLKSYKLHLSKNAFSEVDTEELLILNKALELHKAYIEIKLSKSPHKKKWVQTAIPNAS